VERDPDADGIMSFIKDRYMTNLGDTILTPSAILPPLAGASSVILRRTDDLDQMNRLDSSDRSNREGRLKDKVQAFSNNVARMATTRIKRPAIENTISMAAELDAATSLTPESDVWKYLSAGPRSGSGVSYDGLKSTILNNKVSKVDSLAIKRFFLANSSLTDKAALRKTIRGWSRARNWTPTQEKSMFKAVDEAFTRPSLGGSSRQLVQSMAAVDPSLVPEMKKVLGRSRVFFDLEKLPTLDSTLKTARARRYKKLFSASRVRDPNPGKGKKKLFRSKIPAPGSSRSYRLTRDEISNAIADATGLSGEKLTKATKTFIDQMSEQIVATGGKSKKLTNLLRRMKLTPKDVGVLEAPKARGKKTVLAKTITRALLVTIAVEALRATYSRIKGTRRRRSTRKPDVLSGK